MLQTFAQAVPEEVRGFFQPHHFRGGQVQGEEQRHQKRLSAAPAQPQE